MQAALHPSTQSPATHLEPYYNYYKGGGATVMAIGPPILGRPSGIALRGAMGGDDGDRTDRVVDHWVIPFAQPRPTEQREGL